MGRFALILSFLALPALSADLDSLLTALENRYNRTRTLSVGFTETYRVPGHPPKTESGTLYLRKPGRMRWNYTSPAGKVFVSDGKSIYLFTPANNRVEKMKLRESEDMRAPLAFLLGKLNLRKDFQNFELRQEGADTWISAEPKSENLPYTKVEFLVAPDSQIRRVQLAGLDRSLLQFSFENETRNPQLDTKLFQFHAPPGVELVEGNP